MTRRLSYVDTLKISLIIAGHGNNPNWLAQWHSALNQLGLASFCVQIAEEMRGRRP